MGGLDLLETGENTGKNKKCSSETILIRFMFHRTRNLMCQDVTANSSDFMLSLGGIDLPGKPDPKRDPKERSDGMKLACHFQAPPDSGKFENRAALARHLGVSRARETQVLPRFTFG